MTALAFLRVLTNKHIFGDAALTADAAWQALRRWLKLPGVRFAEEPVGLDDWLANWSHGIRIAGGEWTGAYLAAFAAAGQFRLVTFDADFYRYGGVSLLRLRACD